MIYRFRNEKSHLINKKNIGLNFKLYWLDVEDSKIKKCERKKGK